MPGYKVGASLRPETQARSLQQEAAAAQVRGQSPRAPGCSRTRGGERETQGLSCDHCCGHHIWEHPGAQYLAALCPPAAAGDTHLWGHWQDAHWRASCKLGCLLSIPSHAAPVPSWGPRRTLCGMAPAPGAASGPSPAGESREWLGISVWGCPGHPCSGETMLRALLTTKGECEHPGPPTGLLVKAGPRCLCLPGSSSPGPSLPPRC